MSTYVLTTGLALPTVTELIARMSTEEKANINPLLNTDPDGVVGNLNGIFGSHLREAYEVADVAYHGFDRAAAEGDALDILGALTGTPRRAATFARFAGSKKVTVNLAPGATLPIGSTANVAGESDNRWTTTEAVTNTDIVDADVLVSMVADTTGPRKASPGTLTEITTPVTGWNTVTNTTGPIPGLPDELDGDYRRRQEDELRARGSGTAQAMRADILEIEIDGERPVITASVLENDQDVIDPTTGLPPHSFEVLFDDGLAMLVPNDTVSQVIWDNKPNGIQTFGSASGTATDEFGLPHTMRFSRVNYRYHTVIAEMIIDPALYTGITASKNLVIAASETQKTGKRVRWSTYVDALEEQPGVVAVENIILEWVGGPSGTPFTDLVPGIRDRPLVENASGVGISNTNEADE